MACNDCNKSADLAESIKKASEYLVKGHLGVEALYRVLSSNTKEPDKSTFLIEAEKHARLAQETAQLVLPEDSDG